MVTRSPGHATSGGFGYIGRAHHVPRTSLRDTLRYFEIDEPPEAQAPLDYWDREQSPLYLLAARGIGGWLDFLLALPTRAIADRSDEGDAARADPISLAHHSYLEATLTLGDSIAAGIAGHARAATALIRPFVEHAVTEVYVNRQEGDERLHRYLAYLRGAGHRPRFGMMLDEIFQEDGFRLIASFREQVEAVYSASSSPLHVPTVDDSGLELRDGNRARSTPGEMTFWLGTLGIAVHRMLVLMAVRYPMALFPVDVVARFGYGGPVGMLVDDVISKGIADGIGIRHASALREMLKDDPSVSGILEWYANFPTLSEEEIEADWERFAASHEQSAESFRGAPAEARSSLMRASFGGIVWALDRIAAARYVTAGPDLDLDEVLGSEVLATELRPYYGRSTRPQSDAGAGREA